MSGASGLQAALEYAASGWAVFPCRAQSKEPAIRWREGATIDPNRIERWWGQWPDANVAIATGRRSGFFVIDVDPDGIATWDQLCAANGWPNTPTVHTPRGGWHQYYPHDFERDGDVRNRTGRIAQGIDVRGTGGYVVAPPSRTPEGAYIPAGPVGAAAYGDLLALVQLQAAAVADAALTHNGDHQAGGDSTRGRPHPVSARAATRRFGGVLRDLQRAAVGSRNDTLNRYAYLAGQWVSLGVLEQGQAEQLIEVAIGMGLKPEKVRATFASGFGAGQRQAVATHARARPGRPSSGTSPIGRGASRINPASVNGSHYLAGNASRINPSPTTKTGGVCGECGRSFPPSRVDRVYCSDACRFRAYRQRKQDSRITLVKEDAIMDDTVLTREWFKGELVAYAWTWEGGRLVKLSEADSAELAKGLVAFRDGHITAAEFHVRWGYLEDLVWRR